MTYRPEPDRGAMENKPSLLLNKHENGILFDVIGPRCLTLSSAVVQVLFSDLGHPPRWRIQYCGVACFIKDNPKKSFYIRIYDIVDRVVLWEQELYHEIRYSQALPYFHTFETDDRQAGLNFANEDEAGHFFAMVDDKVALLHRKREDNLRKHAMNHNHNKQSHHTMKVESSRQSNHHPVSTVQSVQAAFPMEKRNVVNTQFDDNKKKPKPKRITKQDIGMPTNFQHKQHVGWDPEKGFDYDDGDPSLQELFQKAGINIKNVDDATRTYIYGFIEKELGGVGAVKKAVVHPPSQSNGTGPAPPPRSHSKVPPTNTGGNTRPQPPRIPVMDTTRPPQRGQPPPPPPPIPQGPPPMLKHQAPSQPRGPAPVRGANSSQAGPPPPPPPPPPPMQLWSSSNGSLAPVSNSSSTSQLSSPSSPDGGDLARNALMDEIKRGRGLKPVDTTSQQQTVMSERDKLLSDIASGVSLKHVDPDKLSLGKPDTTPQLDGMAAALARALAARRPAVETHDDSDDDGDASEDDEWD